VSTIAEIKAAIERLPPQEQEEVKLYLRQLIDRDQSYAAENGDTPQAPSGAASL
jgi:hypothetical protein